jgi:16S rRNA (guanine966-N2)-methyltransferase
MRIVAGKFRGRRLQSPKNGKTRPTSDRVREALFSIIAAHIPQASVLDLFAGTGALGLEALSRGALEAVFVDQDAAAARLIHSNIALCGMQERTRVLHAPVLKALRRLAEEGRCFRLIFLDPPYGKGYLAETLPPLGEVAAPDALTVAEHSVRDEAPAVCGKWLKCRERKYGETAISFYTLEDPR